MTTQTHTTLTAPRFDIVLTQTHQNLLLSALYAKSSETKGYLSSYPATDTPDELDTCCAAHKARFERRNHERSALLERQAHVLDMIAMIEQATIADDQQGPTTALNTVLSGLDRIMLVYRDAQNIEYTQPLADITTAGTLIDPHTGDELELSHVLLTPARQAAQPGDGAWTNTIPRELAGTLRDREDPESVTAAEWLEEHENDDQVWTPIGRLLDQITRMASDDQP